MQLAFGAFCCLKLSLSQNFKKQGGLFIKKWYGISVVFLIGMFLISGCTNEYTKHYDEGMKLYNSAKYTEAVASFDKAIEVNKTKTEAFVARGNSYYEIAVAIGKEKGTKVDEYTTNFDKAISDYNEALKLDSSSKDALDAYNKALIGEGKGTEYFESGKVKKLEKYYESGQTIHYKEEYSELGKLIVKFGYDEKGNEILVINKGDGVHTEKTINYDEHGVISRWDIHEFDSNDRKIKQTYYKPGGEEVCVWTYEYDAKGREVKNPEYRAGKLVDYVINEYNDKDQITKEITYNADGSQQRYALYEYDETGKLYKVTFYSNDGTITNYYIEKYDVFGNLIKRDYYDATGVYQGYRQF